MLKEIMERQREIMADIRALKEQAEVLIVLLGECAADDLKSRVAIKNEMEEVAKELQHKMSDLDENSKRIRMLQNYSK